MAGTECTRDTDAFEPEFIPKILLQGKWLKAAGFEIGRTMRVSVQSGVIVLKALLDPPPAPHVPVRRVFHVATVHEWEPLASPDG